MQYTIYQNCLVYDSQNNIVGFIDRRDGGNITTRAAIMGAVPTHDFNHTDTDKENIIAVGGSVKVMFKDGTNVVINNGDMIIYRNCDILRMRGPRDMQIASLL